MRQALEVFHCLRHVRLASEQIAHRHQGGLVLGIVAEDELIFADSLGHFALVQEFQRIFQRFAFVERHG